MRYGQEMGLKLLFLTQNMEHYVGASYQRDLMDELRRLAKVRFFGPGYPQYQQGNSIQQILDGHEPPDAIVLGHTWLSDREGEEVDIHPGLALHQTQLPKIGILNKEYVNLHKKLKYFQTNQFDLLFTHHHDAVKYSKATGLDVRFLPFAYNHRQFSDAGSVGADREVDLAFSGILQNQNPHAQQSDLRVRIQSRLFYSILDIPLLKRRRFREFRFFWNSIPRSRLAQALARRLGTYRYLSEDIYQAMQKRSKIYINTLSPMGLISPRMFENMASGCLAFCEKSSLYDGIFKNNYFIQFESDLMDFEEQLVFYLRNETERQKLTDRARKDVTENHTWEVRAKSMLTTINALLEGTSGTK